MYPQYGDDEEGRALDALHHPDGEDYPGAHDCYRECLRDKYGHDPRENSLLRYRSEERHVEYNSHHENSEPTYSRHYRPSHYTPCTFGVIVAKTDKAYRFRDDTDQEYWIAKRLIRDLVVRSNNICEGKRWDGFTKTYIEPLFKNEEQTSGR